MQLGRGKKKKVFTQLALGENGLWENCLISPLLWKVRVGRNDLEDSTWIGIQALWSDSRGMWWPSLTCRSHNLQPLNYPFLSPGAKPSLLAPSADFLHRLGCIFGAFPFKAALEMLILTWFSLGVNAEKLRRGWLTLICCRPGNILDMRFKRKK